MKKRLCSELFYEDTEGAHDSLNDTPMNEGSYYRKKLTQNGQTFELEGMLNADVDLKLYPSRSSFVLMSDNLQKEYRIVIEEATFKCCTMDVGSGIISAHSKTLQEGGMAQYFQLISNQQLYYCAGTKKLFRNCISGKNTSQNCGCICKLTKI